MTKHNVDIASLLPQGCVESNINGGTLNMTVTHALPYSNCKPGLVNRHYMELPERYSLPLRIDVIAKIDAPALHIEIGKGFASFGVYLRNNRRMEDICEPKQRINQFDSRIAINAFNEITMLYGYKEMQILVNGEERYYSNKEPYMKSRLLYEMNAERFAIRITCDKNVNLAVTSIDVTEYIGIAPIVRPLRFKPDMDVYDGADPAKIGVKPSFENCIAGLPRELASEAANLDIWLRELKPLKFRRSIEKHGNKITYVASGYGFSYAVFIDGGVLFHQLQWYIITNKKPELWGRKEDRMEDVLNRLAVEDAGFAARMFGNLQECVNGRPAGCLAKTVYSFSGESKVTCHGSMRFKMSTADYADVKRFISAYNELLIEEIGVVEADNEGTTSKK